VLCVSVSPASQPGSVQTHTHAWGTAVIALVNLSSGVFLALRNSHCNLCASSAPQLEYFIRSETLVNLSSGVFLIQGQDAETAPTRRRSSLILILFFNQMISLRHLFLEGGDKSTHEVAVYFRLISWLHNIHA